MAIPKVILYNAVSLDGRIDGFDVDLGEYYRLAGIWNEDCTLVGSRTILKAETGDENDPPEAFQEWQVDKKDKRALMAVVDSRGLVRSWWSLRNSGFWRDVAAICSKSTPADYITYLKERHIDTIIAGNDKVDLRRALEELSDRYGIRTVRVDSGGMLNGILLRQGLVSEVSVLVHPVLAGGDSPDTILRDFDSSHSAIDLCVTDVQKLQNGLVWLRYTVIK